MKINFAVVVAMAALLVCVPAFAGDRCVPVRGTIEADLIPPVGWVGEALWTLGNGEPLKADVTVVSGGTTIQHKFQASGTEIATFDFGGGNTLQLLTKWRAAFRGNKGASELLFRVNESSTIANGTGIFEGAYGRVTAHGPFGPSLASPGTLMGWRSEYHGTICGVQ